MLYFVRPSAADSPVSVSPMTALDLGGTSTFAALGSSGAVASEEVLTISEHYEMVVVTITADEAQRFFRFEYEVDSL